MRTVLNLLFVILCAVFAGELIGTIARRVLHLPVLRFVDDYFSAEQEECAAHAMRIFAR